MFLGRCVCRVAHRDGLVRLDHSLSVGATFFCLSIAQASSHAFPRSISPRRCCAYQWRPSRRCTQPAQRQDMTPAAAAQRTKMGKGKQAECFRFTLDFCTAKLAAHACTPSKFSAAQACMVAPVGAGVFSEGGRREKVAGMWSRCAKPGAARNVWPACPPAPPLHLWPGVTSQAQPSAQGSTAQGFATHGSAAHGSAARVSTVQAPFTQRLPCKTQPRRSSPRKTQLRTAPLRMAPLRMAPPRTAPLRTPPPHRAPLR